jgi:hypothetical protein
MTRIQGTWLRQFSAKLFLGFCFCTVVGLFFSIRGAQGISLKSLSATLPQWYVWGALTPLIIWTDRRLAASHSLTRRLLLHLPASFGWTCVFVAILFLIDRIITGQPFNLTGFAFKSEHTPPGVIGSSETQPPEL